MSISLKKGHSFNLTKKEPSLNKVMIGLGWEMKAGNHLDLDASVFMITANGKIPADEYFVFFNNLKSPDGAVQHTGDNRTGVGEGDDEMILANLPLVNPLIEQILIVVTIHEATIRRHHFGLLDEAYIRIVDVESKREILRYDLGGDFDSYTEVEFGKLKKVDGDWNFIASGIGTNIELQGYVDKYA